MAKLDRRCLYGGLQLSGGVRSLFLAAEISPASQLAAFTYLLPVLATILGIVWLGERGSPMQLGGGALACWVYWIESGRQT
jgi:drug/metabolite transporter (DMT)-like permease